MNKFRYISLFTLLVLLLTACPSPETKVGKVTGLQTEPGAGNIKVTWNYTGTDATGFQIWRTPDKDGNAKYGLISTTTREKREFTDSTANDTSKTYKYGIAVVGAGGTTGDRVDQSGSGTSPNPVDENTAPVAVDDPDYTVVAGETLTVLAATGVLDNDTDADTGDTLTAILVDDVTSGTLTLNADGGLVYDSTGASGTAVTFTYKANDGEDDSNTATVTISISDPGDLAPDGSYKTLAGVKLEAGTTATGTAVKAEKLAVSGTAGGASDPAKGSVVLNADGSFTYTPDAGATGTDSFTYTVGADTGTVTIDIQTANVVNATSIGDVNSAAAGSTIVLASGTYTCSGVTCVTLKADQTLVGQGSDIEIGDITLSTGTGTKPVLSGADTNGIVLITSDPAPPPPTQSTSPIPAGTITIKGISLTGVGFRGIVGMDRLTGTINISDVDITMDTTSDFIGEAVIIRETYSINLPHKSPATGGNYDLIVDDLSILGSRNPEGAFRVNDFKTLTFTNSVIGMAAGRGVYVESEFASTASLDKVRVVASASATSATAFRFLKNNVYENGSNTVTMGLTVANTTATFNGAAATEATNTAYSFEVLFGQDVPGVGGATVADDAGRIVINSAASTGNATNVAPAATRVAKNAASAAKIAGDIAF